MLLQSPGTLQSHLFLLQIFHLQYPEQLQSKWLVFRNFLKNYPLNTWNQVLYSTWVICPWVSSCYCSIIYLLWVLNKKLCKKLFGHKNHHHLLNKYIWYNFFFCLFIKSYLSRATCENASKCRSSRPEAFYKKGIFRNFAKFTGNHLCQSLFFNKVAGLRPVTLLKKRLWYMCFPVNFTKFLRTPFFIDHLWWLLLQLKRRKNEFLSREFVLCH